MRFLLTIAVFAANVWALISVLGSASRGGTRLGWVLGVTLVPIMGAAAWLVLGRRTGKALAAAR
jgi:hypothetical protein